MQNGAQFGRRDRWRAVSDPEFWRQAVVAGMAGAVSTAILACTVALARDTTGHDWYSAYKVTIADLMIGAGFDEDAPVEFRREDGTVETVSRWHLGHDFDARWARDRILEAAWQGATLGGLSGFGGALLCLVLVWRPLDARRGWRPANEPATDRRGEARERSVAARESPAPVSAPATTGSTPSPVTPAPDRPATSEPARSPSAEPAGTRRGRPDSGNDTAKASARGERRNRDHGRWV